MTTITAPAPETSTVSAPNRCAECAPSARVGSPAPQRRVLEGPHGRGFDERTLMNESAGRSRRSFLVAFAGLI